MKLYMVDRIPTVHPHCVCTHEGASRRFFIQVNPINYIAIPHTSTHTPKTKKDFKNLYQNVRVSVFVFRHVWMWWRSFAGIPQRIWWIFAKYKRFKCEITAHRASDRRRERQQPLGMTQSDPDRRQVAVKYDASAGRRCRIMKFAADGCITRSAQKPPTWLHYEKERYV